MALTDQTLINRIHNFFLAKFPEIPFQVKHIATGGRGVGTVVIAVEADKAAGIIKELKALLAKKRNSFSMKIDHSQPHYANTIPQTSPEDVTPVSLGHPQWITVSAEVFPHFLLAPARPKTPVPPPEIDLPPKPAISTVLSEKQRKGRDAKEIIDKVPGFEEVQFVEYVAGALDNPATFVLTVPTERKKPVRILLKSMAAEHDMTDLLNLKTVDSPDGTSKITVPAFIMPVLFGPDINPDTKQKE